MWIGLKDLFAFTSSATPREMNSPQIEAFLTHLAVKQNVAPSTQNQALSALLFLYRNVLHIELTGHIDAVRAQLHPCSHTGPFSVRSPLD